MCNLSQGIMEKGETIGFEKGEAIGRKKGEAIGREKGRKESENKFIINMHEMGYPLEEIAGIMDKGINEVEKVIEG